MILVLDNNSLFSIMNPSSISAYLFSSINAEFIAPEFVKSELEIHKQECLFKSHLTEQEFEMRQVEVEETIEFFNKDAYEESLYLSIKELSDPKDAPYLALALSLKNTTSQDIAVWSNDPHLKQQQVIKVLTTSDLVGMLILGEI